MKMKILIYGAGVLGCNLAHTLYKNSNKKKNKNEITLLARGSWFEEIKNNGLTIKHRLKFKTTNDKINVINELKEDDFYDIIFVVMQFIQIENITDILKRNMSKNIALIGNNMQARKFLEELKDKKVLFGFFKAAGKKSGDKINSVCLNKITIGRIDDKDIDDYFIKSVFKDSKIKVEIENNMDDWLKCHAAFVLPVFYGCCYSNFNLKNIKNDKIFIYKMIDAIKESFDILIELGYKILPKEDYEFVSSAKKRKLCYLFFKICCSTFLGNLIASDHSKAGKIEMLALSEEFNKLKIKANINTPNLNELEKYVPKE